MTFTQLQVISSYSLLKSPLTVPQLVQTAKARGYDAIALTDLNVVYGIVEFYKAATKAGIKPLLGLHVALDTGDCLLIAETTAGYHQLLKVSSAIKLADHALTIPELPAFSGLAAIIPGAALLAQDDARAEQVPAEAKVAAIADRQPADLYLGVTAADLTTALPAFAQSHHIPLIALGNVAYLDPQDAFLKKVLEAIDDNTLLNQRDPTLMDAGPDWLPKPEVAAQPFVDAGFDNALAAQAALVAKIDAEIVFRQPQLPHFATPDGESAKTYLTTLAETGLAKRFAEQAVPQAYQERLAYELGVIDQMGFADYFLVVWDVIHHAHEVGIMTGPGRGSAAGSLVSYALAITEVDPLQYDLLFERFLNPNRKNMPDIDLDIPDDRRAELIQYVHDRYGDDHMAQIITFGTFGAKQALRDVGRVMGLSQGDLSNWSKAVPSDLHITLADAVKKSLPLRNLITDRPENQRLFNIAVALEGLPRHDSTHAAGIVLAQEPLTDTVALQTGSDNIAQTQVPKDDVEALGLLKIDFLGLRNLSILAEASKLVSRLTGKPFDPKQIPLDDPPTLALFARGDTNGVFQFESAGIQAVLKQMQVSQFEDVVAVNALYRPGPKDYINEFIARKRGDKPVVYPVAALAPILRSTYGVLVYQEQVMQVASTMAGFSLAEADTLRRAVSHKEQATLDAQRAKFVAGSQNKGYDAQTAETVFDYIDKFGDYGFNRSHAVAYSMVACWLAFIKVHYPTAFFTAVMNTSFNNTPKLRLYVQELKRRKQPVLGPDINASQRFFTLQADGAIRFGLLNVKGVRNDFASAVLSARQSGAFASLRQLLQRLDVKWQKQEMLMPLIEAGAFDSLEPNRAALAAGLDELIDSVRLAGNDVALFAVLQPKPVAIADWSEGERIERQADVLGVYLSGHPVDRYVAQLSGFHHITPVAQLVEDSKVEVVLVVRRIKRIRTKKGQEMAFIDGQDATGATSVTVFPNQFQGVADLAADSVILVSGRTEMRNDNLQLIADSVVSGEAAVAALPAGQLFLQLPGNVTQTAQRDLLKVLRDHRGSIPVITVNAASKESVMLARAYWVQADDDLLSQLRAQLGEKNVVYRSNKQKSATNVKS
ncbi:DNA polymerase III subunit alpha [Lacticaseibacillus mingshuiensis]|uniref:DNA polymerase III subunit alpha n=1 Tax=Lacticaseibacillus mingshuiensis TaxID=2799574 RepID=A0ABW4CE83_9LACO|nr:DNA polymerase III subunit alpha [Lacticaseibacillus mingshuiensis]